MGRWRWDKKTTVEDCKSISTTFLKKHGYLCAFGYGGMKWTNNMGEQTGSIGFQVSVREWEGEIRFQYTQTPHNGEKENLDYPARLSATPCNYGGKRWWFICPLIKNGMPCNRRVLKLYLGGGKYFGCRHCYDLTYTSAQEHDSRVDALLKNRDLFLRASKNPNDLGMNLIALKAMFKLEAKERKKRR